VTFSKPDRVDLGEITPVMTEFRNEMLSALDRKLAAPLESVSLPASYLAARKRYALVAEIMLAYNQQIAEINTTIEALKQAGSPGSTQAAEKELATLNANKRRFEPAVHEACEKFTAANATKGKSEDEKEKIRRRLNQYSKDTLGRYKDAINRHLKRFTAGFHIDRVKVEYSGRVPNSTFCIVINETPVEVGSHDTALDLPSFRNTLSAGDRSTLALAFFLAGLEEDPPQLPCVVVFDDPFSGQDQFRRTCTIGEIYRCGNSVSQVVVMSHDRNFLKAIWTFRFRQVTVRRCGSSRPEVGTL
jgi:wobble nucleotide-excising tRNase